MVIDDPATIQVAQVVEDCRFGLDFFEMGVGVEMSVSFILCGVIQRCIGELRLLLTNIASIPSIAS